ncbi:hypothetical protein C9374_007799 [Naegleria lovaniensis]|uniref:Major vault protein shoulder domain-containing protein n=1 Tax=Naegleria lovaniensis TaxID=51637 RepID=A0AA88GMK1_NAELO|nr:uncharacterized protein C9374_007799 [Naegleria lovaniensis]KAG2379161.1 hypothetical protein C9374_007799 [Naegleria lovaniensis]
MNVLSANQYVHILDNDSGVVRIEIGPKRIALRANEEIIKTNDLSIIKEGQYCIIKNPYDYEQERNLMGERKIVCGPIALALHRNEYIERVSDVHILKYNQALRLRSLVEKKVLVDGKEKDLKAGDVYQITGPCRFVPDKDTEVLKTVDSIMINENEGIYVIDTETSEKSLVKGPKSYLMKATEELFYKQYTEMERAALGLGDASTYEATVIRLEKKQVVCVLDAERNETVINGPCSYILSAEQHVKCLHLSAGKPKRVKQIKAAKIMKGPDFTSDSFRVSTRDNAELQVLLTYKWEFLVDDSESHVMFRMTDFIGYVCATLNSRVRELAALFTFEEFHSGTVSLIRKHLFRESVVKVGEEERKVLGIYFDEIKLLISEIDVKEVSPVNNQINDLLNQSIKSNMKIVCNKMETEASREAQKEQLKAQAEIQKLREELIDIENENMQIEKLENARIDSLVVAEQTKTNIEVQEYKCGGDTTIELEHMKNMIELLGTEQGQKYLALKKAELANAIPEQMWYLNNDKLHSSLFQ